MQISFKTTEELCKLLFVKPLAETIAFLSLKII